MRYVEGLCPVVFLVVANYVVPQGASKEPESGPLRRFGWFPLPFKGRLYKPPCTYWPLYTSKVLSSKHSWFSYK